MPNTSCVHMIQLCQYIYLTWTMNFNVTMTTGMHTPHITGICPWTNMPATLHICVPLHFYCRLKINPTFLYISIKINKLQHILTKLLQNVCQNKHAPWLWDVHLWGSYANMYAMLKVTVIKMVVFRKGHRQTDDLWLHKLIHQIS